MLLSFLSLLVMLITILFVIFFNIVLILDLLKFILIGFLVTFKGHLDLLGIFAALTH